MAVDAKRVQAAFLAAVEVADPVQQAAVLEQECASDIELRRRVEALLQAHRDPVSILNRPTPEQIMSLMHTENMGDKAARGESTADAHQIELGFLEPSMKSGALGRMGHYEVLEVLGRGGFGIVL